MWLGKLSYAMFLVHEPVAMFVNAARVGPNPFSHCRCIHDLSPECQVMRRRPSTIEQRVSTCALFAHLFASLFIEPTELTDCLSAAPRVPRQDKCDLFLRRRELAGWSVPVCVVASVAAAALIHHVVEVPLQVTVPTRF